MILNAEQDVRMKNAITRGFNFVANNPNEDFEYETTKSLSGAYIDITAQTHETLALFNAISGPEEFSPEELAHCVGRLSSGLMFAYNRHCDNTGHAEDANGNITFSSFIKLKHRN
jgi:hypothetical protein